MTTISRQEWAFWSGLALCALLVQLWASDPAVYLGHTDAAKYLTLARNAPEHVLFEGRFFALHPPVHGYLIRVASLGVLELPTAGVLVSVLSSVGLVLVTCALGRRILGSLAGGMIAGVLLLLAGSTTLLGQGIWREPLHTLAIHGVMLFGLSGAAQTDDSPSRRKRVTQQLVAGAFGAVSGLIWDPMVFAAPVLIVAGLLLKRRLLVIAAVALLVTWSVWATARYTIVRGDPTLPTGMDGMLEPSSADPGIGFRPLVFLSPNRLPLTARWDAHQWPLAATPQRVFYDLAPRIFFEGIEVLSPTPSRVAGLGALLVFAMVLCGGVLLARGPPPTPQRAELLMLAAVGVGLGLPVLAGRAPRYGYPMLPLLCVVAGACGRALWPRLEMKVAARAVGIGVALLVVAWAVARPATSLTRPKYTEGRSILLAVERQGLTGDSRVIVGTHGLTPELCWLFPGATVVTLPLDGAPDLPALLAEREANLVVVPHEVHVARSLAGDPEVTRFVYGLAAIEGVHRLAQAGGLRHLGVVLEAESSDHPRARAFDLFWRVTPGAADPPVAFGLIVEPQAFAALRDLLGRGELSTETRRLLQAHRAHVRAAAQSDADAQAVLDHLAGPQ